MSPTNLQSTSSYAPSGLLVFHQNGALAPTEFQYDSRGRLEAAWRTVGGVQTRRVDFAYHPLTTDPAIAHQSGLLSSVTLPATPDRPSGRTFGYGYDRGLRPDAISLPTDAPTADRIALLYDPNGNLTRLTPPGRSDHEFEYTPVDLPKWYLPPSAPGLTIPDDRKTRYQTNLDRKLERADIPGGLFVAPHYESRSGLVDYLTYGDATSSTRVDIGYGPGGHIESLSTPSQRIFQRYDGFLPTDSFNSGSTVQGMIRRVYDNFFRLKKQAVAGGETVTSWYDDEDPSNNGRADRLLASIDIGTTKSLTLERNPAHNYATAFLTGTSAGAVSTQQRYTIYGELQSLSSSFDSKAWNIEYVYGDDGRIIERTDATDSTTVQATQYAYDARGRLKSVTTPAGAETYTYDSNGNRLTINGGAQWQYDGQDRLETAYLPGPSQTERTVSYTYSPNGALATRTEGTSTTTYTYDVFGNLTRVVLPGGRTLEYIVDPRNRRVGKKEGTTLLQGFLYDGQLRVVAELGPNLVDATCSAPTDCDDGQTCSAGFCSVGGVRQQRNEVVSQFVYGTRSNVPDLMRKKVGGTFHTYRILADHLGSVRYVVDTADGSIAQQLDYDAWGNVLTDSINPGFQPFGFAGGLYDRDTKLVRFGARDYAPEVGRWTSKDPIRFAGGDTNLYLYGFADPANNTDPTGLDVWIEGPSGDEPEGHQSINIGNPFGAYTSWSFAISPTFGSVYRDEDRGGEISAYMRTTPIQDLIAYEFLRIQETRDNQMYYGPNTCRTYSQGKFVQLIEILGVGPSTPPFRQPAPRRWYRQWLWPTSAPISSTTSSTAFGDWW